MSNKKSNFLNVEVDSSPNVFEERGNVLFIMNRWVIVITETGTDKRMMCSKFVLCIPDKINIYPFVESKKIVKIENLFGNYANTRRVVVDSKWIQPRKLKMREKRQFSFISYGKEILFIIKFVR